MLFLLYTLHIVICTFLILVILLQQGSGADLSVFGGGGTQTAFGARGATQVIHKLTVWGFVGFIVLTFGIALVQGTAKRASVMSDVETAADAPAEIPAEADASEAASEAPAETATETPAAPAEAGAGAVEGAADGAAEAPDGASAEAPVEDSGSDS